MALDSKVSFQQRAAQVFVPVEDVTRLEAAGIDTFAKFAFCFNVQPGSQDDAPLLTYLETVIWKQACRSCSIQLQEIVFRVPCSVSSGFKIKVGTNRPVRIQDPATCREGRTYGPFEKLTTWLADHTGVRAFS